MITECFVFCNRLFCFPFYKLFCSLALMNTYGERLQEGMKEAGLNQEELAGRVGLKQQSIQYLLRRGRSSRYNTQIAWELGLNPDWLATGRGPKRVARPREAPANHTGVYPHDGEPINGEHMVPLYENRASAGSGQPVYTEEPNGHIAFQAAWLQRRGLDRQELLAIEAAGDSMMPYIHDGDTVLIVREFDRFQNGQVYVFRVADDLRIKRIFLTTSGAVRICSDNPDKALYPDEVVPADQARQLNVIGRVVWRGG